MLLILGIRATLAHLATVVYVCDRCGQNAPHDVVKRVRKLTVFFLPLLPVGTKYLDTCRVCGRTLQVPKDRALAAAGR